jgi:hypothetical protein
MPIYLFLLDFQLLVGFSRISYELGLISGTSFLFPLLMFAFLLVPCLSCCSVCYYTFVVCFEVSIVMLTFPPLDYFGSYKSLYFCMKFRVVFYFYEKVIGILMGNVLNL